MRKALNLDLLEKAVDYKFTNRELLIEAFTHSSYSSEKKYTVAHNERLEFFGDSVVQLITSEYLFQLFPDAPEGELTKMRSAMTRKEGLAQLAKILDLGSYLRLGVGEARSKGYLLESTLENTFEAFLGALYLDGGYETARKILLYCNKKAWPQPLELLHSSNPKGTLQEIAQSRFKSLPYYKTIGRTGPEHLPLFQVEVTIGGQTFCGTGKSRRDAESNAAEEALKALSAEKQD